MNQLSQLQAARKLIPVQAAYQALRYSRMGHGDLFTQVGAIQASEQAAFACALVEGDFSQEHLEDHELPAGAERDDVERILRQLHRDFHDGVLMLVYPTPEQLKQIEADGIRLHQARLDVLLAAIRHRVTHGLIDADKFSYDFMHYQLSNGFLVVIKTN